MFKRITTASLAAILIVPVATLGQTRSRSSRPRPAPKTTTQPVSAVRTAGATRVADQIKLMTKFIYLLGGVTSGIAAVDEAAKRNEASPQLLQQNQANKAQVKGSIQNFRVGLDKLETILQHNQGLNPADFDYAFNLGYGQQYTAADPLLAALRERLDQETARRARET